MRTLLIVVGLAGLVYAVGAGLLAWRNRPAGRSLVLAAAVLEVATLVVLVAAVAGLVGGHRPVELVTTIAYVLTLALVMPAATAWSLVERTRWSSAVLALGGLTVAAMSARVDALWRVTRG